MSMTLDEVMARAERVFDGRIASEIEANIGALIEANVNDAALEEFRQSRAAELERWKMEALAEVRRGLTDWDAPSAKLQ